MQEVFNLKQAAAKLGMSDVNLRRKVTSGQITHYRPTKSGKIMFREQHLVDFEKRQTVEAKESDRFGVDKSKAKEKLHTYDA